MVNNKLLWRTLAIVLIMALAVPLTAALAAPDAQSGVTATANANLNMRSGPGTQYQKVGTFTYLATAPVIGRNQNNLWLLIDFNGQRGWVAAWNVHLVGALNTVPVTNEIITPGGGGGGGSGLPPTGVIATPAYNLRLRAGPGGSFATLGTVPSGTPVDVLGKSSAGDWLFVAYNGGEGWIAAWLSFISGDLGIVPVTDASGNVGGGGGAPAPTPAPGPAPAPPPPGVLTATPNNTLNFRSGPGTNFPVIGSVPRGTAVPVLARNSAATWVKVEYAGKQGWLAAWLTTLSGSISGAPVEDPAPSAAPPPAAPPPSTGGAFQLGGQTHTFANPGVMRSAGMTWVKVQQKWSPGMNPADLATIINRAHAEGFRILISIPGQLYPSAIDYNSYVSYVRGVAALGADAIEVWNEMNLDREWPAGQISPAAYVNFMLAPAYNAIKSANPGTMVIAGALAPTGVHNVVTVWADDVYLAGMRDAGAARYMDCLGVHHNAGATPPSQTFGHPADGGGGHYSWYYKKTFDVYANTFRSTPLCFTEIGYLSPQGYGSAPPNFWWGNNTTVAQHAAWLGEAARMARLSGRVRLFIVFNVDITTWGDDPQAGYAIIRPGGSCPACGSLAASLS